MGGGKRGHRCVFGTRQSLACSGLGCYSLRFLGSSTQDCQKPYTGYPTSSLHASLPSLTGLSGFNIRFVGYDNHAVFKPHWGYYQSLVITGLPIVMIGVMYFIIGTAFFRGWLVCWRKEKQTRPTETNRRWLQQLLLVSVILLLYVRFFFSPLRVCDTHCIAI